MSFTSLKAALFVSLNIVYLKNSIGVTNVVKETEKEEKKKRQIRTYSSLMIGRERVR